MNFMENIPEIGTANRRGAVTVRKSASIKVVACMMAWSMITAWGLSEAGEFHAVAVLDEQPEPHHTSTVRTSGSRRTTALTCSAVIYVSRGVVTLTGIVSTPDQKSRAEQLASEVEGVTAVVNHIAVSDVRP